VCCSRISRNTSASVLLVVTTTGVAGTFAFVLRTSALKSTTVDHSFVQRSDAGRIDVCQKRLNVSRKLIIHKYGE
jgi:hypothetical protein